MENLNKTFSFSIFILLILSQISCVNSSYESARMLII